MNRIAESELIVNPRGAVYHLDLRPEELAPNIFVVGDPDRVPLVSRYFDGIDTKRQHREFVTHTGTLGRKRFSVISTGIGTDNIDIVMNEIDALYNIDFESRRVKPDLQSLQVIRIGTSGSLQADIPVDGFVASTHGLGLDNLLNFYLGSHSEDESALLRAFVAHTQIDASLAQPTLCTGSAALLKHFTDGFHTGITVTCPGFYGPQGRVLRLGLRNPHLVNRLTDFRFGPYRVSNFEMETSAIYGLGRMLGHRCLSLNAIVANRVSQTFSADAASAIDKLIRRALEIAGSINP